MGGSVYLGELKARRPGTGSGTWAYYNVCRLNSLRSRLSLNRPRLLVMAGLVEEVAVGDLCGKSYALRQ